MSDSSEDEDLSRFKEAVDNSFTKLFDKSRGESEITTLKEKPKFKSERFLEESSHYNDVKVPEEMQKRIGAKISAIITKNVEFIEVQQNRDKKRKIKGGVKLFKDSEALISSEEPKDTYTESHNRESRKMTKKRKDIECDGLDEDEKIKAVTLTGEYIMSKEETKLWKSRRKEKIFRYEGKGRSKMLLLKESIS